METATYGTTARVKKLLPRGYDNATELPDADIDTERARQSRIVDSYLGEIFNPFNGASDTPPTPPMIAEINEYLTAAALIPVLQAYTRNPELQDMARTFEKLALEKIVALKGGDDEENISPIPLPDEAFTNVALSWGSGSEEDLGPTEAFLFSTSPIVSGEVITLLLDTIRVTAPAERIHSRNGQDFEVYFHPTHNLWVFADLTGRLHGAAGVTVSGRWSWKRYLGIQEPAAPESAEWLP